MQNNQKHAMILELMDILRKGSDEIHGLSLKQILSQLEARGYSITRQALYNNLTLLNSHGFCVEARRYASSTRYHYLSSGLELAEWKLLVDAVQSSRFITDKKSKTMVHKMANYISRYEAEELNRELYVQGKNKYTNETILYLVDTLHRALREEVQISFLYYNWNAKKEKVYHRNGDRIVVNPWGLVWQEDNYYLISTEPSAAEIRHFRVDKMESVKLLDTKRPSVPPKELSGSVAYTDSTFGMFAGTPIPITLRVSNPLAGVIIDRFGRDILFRPQDDGHFLTTVSVIPSPLFYGWALSFGKDLQIISPQNIVQEWKQQALDAIQL